MARPRKYKPAEVVDALQKAHGLKTGAAELLGSSYNSIDKYCADFPECQAVVDHWRKRRKDRAEYKLDEAIERGESWAIMFTLKNAQDREYSDRVEVTARIDRVEPYEYGAAIAPLAPRPMGDSLTPGQGEGNLHGPEVGENADGG